MTELLTPTCKLVCHSLTTCEELRNVDSMIGGYIQTICTVINLLTETPDVIIDKLWGVLLNVDEKCSSACGVKTRFKSLCSQCKCLSVLSDIELEKPFMIECGSMMGTYLSVIRMNDTSTLNITIDNDLRNETIRLINVEKKMLECGTPDSRDVVFLRCDPITCHVLVSWLVESALKDGYNLLSSYVCGGSVYTLSRVRNSLLNISSEMMTDENIVTILMQSIMCIRQLSKYHFVHGEPSPAMIRIVNYPISKLMDSVHIYGNITIGIEPGNKSSITSWKTRVCGDTKKWRMSSLTPTMDNKWITSNVTLYSLPEETFEAFMSRRAAGIPIYPGSLEIYCLMVGLYCNPKFRKHINNLGWSNLWIGSGDLETIESRILGWKSKTHNMYPSFQEIIHMIKGLWLRCDAVEVMWSKMPRMKGKEPKK